MVDERPPSHSDPAHNLFNALEKARDRQNNAKRDSTPPSNSPPPKNKKGIKIIALILVFLGLGYGIYRWRSPNSPSAPPPSDPAASPSESGPPPEAPPYPDTLMTLDPASKADPAPPPANTISPPAELIPHSDPIDPPPPNENDGDRGLSSAPQDPMDPPLADDGMNHGFPPEGSSFDNNTQQMPMDPPLDPGFTE